MKNYSEENKIILKDLENLEKKNIENEKKIEILEKKNIENEKKIEISRLLIEEKKNFPIEKNLIKKKKEKIYENDLNKILLNDDIESLNLIFEENKEKLENQEIFDFCINNGKMKILNFLLEKNLNKKKLIKNISIIIKNFDFKIYKENLLTKKIDKLIEENYDIYEKDDKENNFIYYLIKKKQKNIILYILLKTKDSKKNKNIDLEKYQESDYEMLSFLQNNNFEIKFPDIFYLIDKGNCESIKLLIKFGINLRDKKKELNRYVKVKTNPFIYCFQLEIIDNRILKTFMENGIFSIRDYNDQYILKYLKSNRDILLSLQEKVKY